MTVSCAPAPSATDSGADSHRPVGQVAPPARSARYHSLDFWRGVACLLVIVYHSTFYAATPKLLAAVRAGAGSFADALIAAATWLWVGVPIFFVISGYCISATADSTRRKSAPVRLYFWRRLRRIFPPYWIFLAMSVAVVWAVERHIAPGLFCDSTHPFPDPASLSPIQWLGTVSLTEIWRPHLFGPVQRLFLQHAWTLCYEEQFYAVVGVILLISPRRFFSLAALVTGAVFTLEWFHVGRAPMLGFIHRNSTGFFFDGYWLFFAAGIGVYYFLNYARPLGRLVLVGAFLFGVAWGLRTNNETRTVSFAYALLLLVLHRWDTALAAARWSAPVTWCGTMCYSLYLVHLPVCKALSHMLVRVGIDSPLETVLITLPLCIAASVLVAWPFHVWVERRFLNAPPAARPRRTVDGTAPAAAMPA